MDIRRGGLGEGAKEILKQLGLKIADLWRRTFPIAHAVNAAGKVEGRHSEAIIHGHEEIAGAQNPAFVSQSLFDGFAERDADVLNRVVLVNVEVAFRAECEVEPAVARDLLEHVVEEADAGGNCSFPVAVEVQAERNVGFFGGALQRSFSHWASLWTGCDHCNAEESSLDSLRSLGMTTEHKGNGRVIGRP
jgi:hypothetical protein